MESRSRRGAARTAARQASKAYLNEVFILLLSVWSRCVWSLHKMKVRSRRGSRKENENTLKNRLAETSSECKLTCNTKFFESISLH